MVPDVSFLKANVRVPLVLLSISAQWFGYFWPNGTRLGVLDKNQGCQSL